MVENKIIRATAIKTAIIEIIRGEYIQEKEQNPNYLKTADGNIIYRINTLGIIASKDRVGSMTNMLLDDGTGQITLRFFEENALLEKIDLGNVVLVIGKVRIFNEEKYISAEIVKKSNPDWLKVRLAELNQKIDRLTSKEIENKKLEKDIPRKKEKRKMIHNQPEKPIEEEVVEEIANEPIIENSSQLPIDKLLQLIKELDKGDGAHIEDIIEKSTVDDPEKILEKMLENGDIFQNQPGKVKVL